jgi:indolepyruvate ferredoxin oxidoreductase alpha subunit
MTGLMGITYNKGISKVLILDNSITAMTGHQQNPSTGYTLKGEAAPQISIEGICLALGIKEETIKTFDPCDIVAAEQSLKEEMAKPSPCVMIARRPCAMLKYVKKDKKYGVRDCRGCKACISAGCPAIKFENKKAEIDPSVCAGCGVCEKLCKFDSIGEVK